MDAEFIDFLDKKFNRLEAKIDGVETSLNKKIDGVQMSLNEKIDGVETSLNKKIDGVQASLNKKIDGVQIDLNTKFFSLKEDISAINQRLTRIEVAVENLTNSVDRIIDMYEESKIEQKMIIADINRIKVVLREKLGVQI